jgi:hypothetical protein
MTALAINAAAIIVPTTGSAQQAPSAAPGAERPLPSRHIEGRIAFLRTELKITDAQQTQWERVAAAMRANASQRDQLVQRRRAMSAQPVSAVDALDQRASAAAERATAEKNFADAFKPLYASLSDEQKKIADELFNRHHGMDRRH